MGKIWKGECHSAEKTRKFTRYSHILDQNNISLLNYAILKLRWGMLAQPCLRLCRILEGSFFGCHLCWLSHVSQFSATSTLTSSPLSSLIPAATKPCVSCGTHTNLFWAQSACAKGSFIMSLFTCKYLNSCPPVFVRHFGFCPNFSRVLDLKNLS